MSYTPTNQTNFSAHYKAINPTDQTRGDVEETIYDGNDNLFNDLIERLGFLEVADIAALRAIRDLASYSQDNSQHITKDMQIRRVKAASDGTNTFRALYLYINGDSTADADGASGNVDTDGIVRPSNSSVDLQPGSGAANGRWFRIAGTGSGGGAGLYVHQDGIEALRTMLKNLYINLTAGSSDVA